MVESSTSEKPIYLTLDCERAQINVLSFIRDRHDNICRQWQDPDPEVTAAALEHLSGCSDSFCSLLRQTEKQYESLKKMMEMSDIDIGITSNWISMGRRITELEGRLSEMLSRDVAP